MQGGGCGACLAALKTDSGVSDSTRMVTFVRLRPSFNLQSPPLVREPSASHAQMPLTLAAHDDAFGKQRLCRHPLDPVRNGVVQSGGGGGGT